MAALEKGTNEAFGEHCMEFFMPEFRQQVKEGANIVVAGDAFGCGSSRETAVTSLLGESQIQALMLFTYALYPSHLRPVFEPTCPFRSDLRLTLASYLRLRRPMRNRKIIRIHLLPQPAEPGPPWLQHQGPGILRPCATGGFNLN